MFGDDILTEIPTSAVAGSGESIDIQLRNQTSRPLGESPSVQTELLPSRQIRLLSEATDDIAALEQTFEASGLPEEEPPPVQRADFFWLTLQLRAAALQRDITALASPERTSLSRWHRRLSPDTQSTDELAAEFARIMSSYMAEKLKERGNDAFRAGDYDEAETLYTQAIQRYSSNPLIYTNRANARLKLQRWNDAANDCLKSIEITGPDGQNHKAYYFLANAQLGLNHPNEALSSAMKAYEQALYPSSPAARISAKELAAFSAQALKCRRAKFVARDHERRRQQHDLRFELENALEMTKKRDLEEISLELSRGELGQIAASERTEEVLSTFNSKTETLRSVFAIAEPGIHQREVPDHVIDNITFEPMHDPVVTVSGHSYERSVIYEHLKRNPVDPVTREPMTIDDLRTNFALRAACDEFWASGASEWIGDWQ